MKYKFLYRMLNSRRSIETFSCKSKSISSEIYSEIYAYLYRFKSERTSLDCSCLDSIMDTLLSDSNNIFSTDVDNLFATVKKILSVSSVEDVRVFFLFYIYLDFIIIDLGASKGSDGNIVININMDVLGLFHYLSTVFSILAGGILYKPVKINNSFLTIGTELDKIFDKNYSGFIYNFEGIDEKYLKKGSISHFFNVIFSKSKSPSFYIGVRDYYDGLLNLCNALNLESISKNLMGKISVDDFKISAVYVTYNLDNVNFKEYRIGRDFVDTFYNRKVMVPNGGLILSIEEICSDVLILESDSELLGYNILVLERCKDLGLSKCDFIFLRSRESTIRVPRGFVRYAMDVYGIVEETPDEGFASLPVRYETGVSRTSVDIIATTMDGIGEYEVYSPDYWKYRGKTSNSKSSDARSEDSFIKKRITINPFKRRLPSGQIRSQSANERANHLCVKLEDGETLVSGFEKWQRSNNF